MYFCILFIFVYLILLIICIRYYIIYIIICGSQWHVNACSLIPIISEPPVLSPNLGGSMNDNAPLSRVGTQSSPSSARRCAARRPFLRIVCDACGLKPIPIEEGRWIDGRPPRVLNQGFKRVSIAEHGVYAKKVVYLLDALTEARSCTGPVLINVHKVSPPSDTALITPLDLHVALFHNL